MSRPTLYYLLICLITLCSLFSSPTRATTITVNTTADDYAANGNCTLGEAITAANINAVVDNCTAGESGSDTIDLTGIGGGIFLFRNLPIIIEALTIKGPGSGSLLVNANGVGGSIFEINSPNGDQTVNISGLRITGGDIAGNGGGIYVYSGDTLNLISSSIDNNKGNLDGGGIINEGTLTLTDCTVMFNTATSRGGGIMNAYGTLTITNSTVSDNTSITGDGGGIFNFDGTVTLNNSTITNNHAVNFMGGGIYNRINSTLTLTDCTVSDNTAGTWGGGIGSNGTMILTDCTVSRNTDYFGAAGILNQGTIALTNTTVTGNNGIGFYNSAGDLTEAEFTNCTIAFNTIGGINISHPALVKNTIVAQNGSYDCSGSGPIISNGYNLDSDNTCGFTITGDLSNIDPLLGPLQDNGGHTKTHALQAESPAIDAGDNTVCPATDQRGITRPQDGDGDSVAVCDIGAYELFLSKAMPWIPLLMLDN